MFPIDSVEVELPLKWGCPSELILALISVVVLNALLPVGQKEWAVPYVASNILTTVKVSLFCK